MMDDDGGQLRLIRGKKAEHGRHEHHEHGGHDHSEQSHSEHRHSEHDHSDHSHHSHGGHGHAHAPANFDRAFVVGLLLNVSFVVAEVIYGLSAHSLALVSDAGHNASDVLGLVVAWVAMRLSRSQPTARRTYGFRRSSILAALSNAALLLVVTGGVTWEAIRRLQQPSPVVAMTIIWVAALGIAVNGVTAMMFFSGRAHDVNIRGAFMHMAADALVALGVVIAGLAIRWTGRLWIDPVVGIAIGVVIVIGTWGLLRESVNLAMDAVPGHIDPSAVSAYLESFPGVTAVHDLHIWAMSTTETALTAHLVVGEGGLSDSGLRQMADSLRDRFKIGHCTFQTEQGDDAHPCAQEPATAV